MRAVALIALLGAAGIPIFLWSGRAIRAAPPQAKPIFLNVGESIQVSSVPVGCKVIRFKGSRALDCRIAGALPGSYGTISTGQRLLVVRFKSDHVARIVFDARQHGGFKVCRRP
jgi:hypothetical protein